MHDAWGGCDKLGTVSLSIHRVSLPVCPRMKLVTPQDVPPLQAPAGRIPVRGALSRSPIPVAECSKRHTGVPRRKFETTRAK